MHLGVIQALQVIVGLLLRVGVLVEVGILVGPNYIDWKRNLNLVLTVEEYKFVLTDVCPPPLDIDSSKEEVEAYL